MKKDINLIINDKFYSNLNKHIEMNLRLRSLKYFSKKANPIKEEFTSNNDIKKKIQEKEKEYIQAVI